MIDYSSEFHCLKQILQEQKSVAEAFFRATMEEKLSVTGKKAFKENIYGILRHYFSLSFELATLLPYEKNAEETILSLIPLYELRYHKNINAEEISARYHDTFLKNRLQGNPKNNFHILYQASQQPFKIDEEVKKAPYLYNSLILELPEFLLKRFAKDFSVEESLKLALTLHRKPSFFYARENNDNSLLTNDSFEKVILPNDEILYKSNSRLSLKEGKEKDLYPISLLSYLAYFQVDLPTLKPRLLVCNCIDPSYITFFSLRTKDYYQSEIKANFSAPLSYRQAFDYKVAYHLDNLSLLHSDSTLLKTFTSYDSYDLVISYGSDCKIGLSRKKPEILPSLKEKDLFKSHQRQLSDLLEHAEFVKKNGVLLFLNHSLDKEESNSVINAFLKQRDDFSVEKKEFLFPNQYDSDGGYFALLRKVK